MESKKNKCSSNFVTDKKMVLSDSIRTEIKHSQKKVASGFVSYAFKNSQEFKKSLEASKTYNNFINKARSFSSSMKNSLNEMIYDPSTENILQKIRRSSSSILSLLKQSSELNVSKSSKTDIIEKSIEIFPDYNNIVLKSQIFKEQSSELNVSKSTKIEKSMEIFPDSVFDSTDQPSLDNSMFQDQMISMESSFLLNGNKSVKKFKKSKKKSKVKRVYETLSRNEPKKCPNYEICRGKGNASKTHVVEKDGRRHYALRNCPYLISEEDKKQIKLIDQLSIGDIGNLKELFQYDSIKEDFNTSTFGGSNSIKTKNVLTNHSVLSEFKKIPGKTDLMNNFLGHTSSSNLFIEDSEVSCPDPIDILSEIESDTESLKELQDALNIPRVSKKPSILKSISLDLQKNSQVRENEIHEILKDPKYQSNLSFHSEKLIDELKDSNKILSNHLEIYRQESSDLKMKLNSVHEENKNLKKKISDQTEKYSSENQDLKITIKKNTEDKQNFENEKKNLNEIIKNLIKEKNNVIETSECLKVKLDETKKTFQKRKRFTFERCENINIEPIEFSCSNEQKIKEEQKLMPKRCPLFQKCEGKGNNKTENGKRHIVFENCPLFGTIGSEINLKKDLKQTTSFYFKKSYSKIKKLQTPKHL